MQPELRISAAKDRVMAKSVDGQIDLGHGDWKGLELV